MENGISFLSKDNLIKHNEYLKRLRLEYAILEKSFSELKGLSSGRILKTNLERGTKLEAYEAKFEIELHESFFSSFSHKNCISRLPFLNNTSQAGFLYEIECEIKSREPLFLIIYKTKNGYLSYQLIKSYTDIPRAEPQLSLDLCEHSYFSDYGFDKQRYIRCALSTLDFNKIT